VLQKGRGGRQIASTSANGRDAPQVARERVLDLVLRHGPGRVAVGGGAGPRRPRRRVLALLPQQRVHRHDKPGRAEAALGAVRLAQGLLHGVQAVAHAPDALDRHDVGADHGVQRAQAGVDRAVAGPGALSVPVGHHDGAGAAAALAAAQLGAGEAGLCGVCACGWGSGANTHVLREAFRVGWRRRPLAGSSAPARARDGHAVGNEQKNNSPRRYCSSVASARPSGRTWRLPLTKHAGSPSGANTSGRARSQSSADAIDWLEGGGGGWCAKEWGRGRPTRRSLRRRRAPMK
jgi:hypothetical protein